MARRPRHATVVAYVALAVALSAPAAAVAANALHVRSQDIVNGQVKRVDIGGNAVVGSKVAPNSLTGRDINESSLLVSRVSNHIAGNQTVQAPYDPPTSTHPYPLNHNRYRQPAGSSELYAGNFKVFFPAACDPSPGGGSRSADVEIFVNGRPVGAGFASDDGTNDKTVTGSILTVGGGFAVPRTTTKTVTAQVSSRCEPTTSTIPPNVLSVRIDVLRFQ